MKLSTFIIGLVMFMFLIVGFYSFAQDLAGTNYYNVNVDTQYTTAFDNSINISNQITDSYGRIQNWTTNKDSAYSIITLVPDALSLLKSMISLPMNLASETADSIVTYLQLPAWTSTFMLIVIPLILIFLFVALVLGRENA